MSIYRRRFLSLLTVFAFLFAALSSAMAANIGIYFGTFDPPHAGHIRVAKDAAAKLALDAVYMLPNYTPSNKPGATAFDKRYQMVRLVTLNEPAVKLIEPEDFVDAYKTGKDDYISVIIDLIRKKHGRASSYYHICGTDSFEKMQQYGKLPAPGENRVVAVFDRKGYKLEMNAASKKLAAENKILFFENDIMEISSSAIRKKFASGEAPAAGEIPEYISGYVSRNGLYGCKNSKKPLEGLFENIPAGYSFQAVDCGAFSEAPCAHRKIDFSEIAGPAILYEPLTMDVSGYCASKIPSAVREFVLRHGPGLLLAGGLYEEAMPLLAKLGFKKMYSYRARKERVSLEYLFGYKDGKPYIVVTNVFGADRFYHMTLEYANLYSRSGLSMDLFSAYASPDFASLSARLCAGALKELYADDRAVAVIGYRGAFNNVISDIQNYMRETGDVYPEDIPAAVIDSFAEARPRKIIESVTRGSVYYPYWHFQMRSRKHSRVDFYFFRNLYGDQTFDALAELGSRGFKRFILFGNAGALSEKTGIGNIYAPVFASDGRGFLALKNAACADYPSGSILKARSILEESYSWLKKSAGHDLVDVEFFEAARALKNIEGSLIYAGALASDRPGSQDIVSKNEDAAGFIDAKRKFIFGALNYFLKN